VLLVVFSPVFSSTQFQIRTLVGAAPRAVRH
jgi:hypothetical protein